MASADQPLIGRRILVCVTASIAAYKSVYLVRSLVKLGAHVSVAMTPSASRFVGAATFSAVASEPAFDDLWDNRGSIAHTTLGRTSDLVLVMPATASIIAKSAHGIADDIVSATLLCTPQTTPVVFVPAMHEEMYDNVSTQKNISDLTSRGQYFVGPDDGELAGGDTGRGRLVETDTVIDRVIDMLKDLPFQVLQGPTLSVDNSFAGSDPAINQSVMLVTAGGTREPIDTVRVITNRSTGKMGHAIAHAAMLSGYRVILVTTSDLETDPGIERVEVETAQEMHDAVMRYLEQADVVVMSAAVADVTPAQVSEIKLKREKGIESIELIPTPDIIADIVANKAIGTYVVCFGAESEYVLENAAKKFESKKVDMLIANDVSRSDSGFGSDTNKIWIFDHAGHSPRELDTAPKDVLGFEIVELIDTNRSSI
ncbi:MAG TPA: bifunctional phosphopantothenoylcysteine decarboxylase/phosphopantothenate--cysteine ligase CoaBC [Acidimicrobiia bacterium]|nr:bifunctional phosphopantothenoylcysteine decarboxylase/phosphopantothenate--cysteine ligase CoaBC [Acidimicrobiia bacterium]